MTTFERIMRIRRAVVFRFEQDIFGSCYPELVGKPIVINLSRHERNDPVRTYIHECLHILYPNLSEKEIRGMESKVWKSLTSKQRFFLARKLYNREWKVR